MHDGIKLTKRLRKVIMAKRKKLKGRSARHGRAPAPYTKYAKKEFQYSAGYYEWKRTVMNKRSVPTSARVQNVDKRQYAMAAE